MRRLAGLTNLAACTISLLLALFFALPRDYPGHDFTPVLLALYGPAAVLLQLLLVAFSFVDFEFGKRFQWLVRGLSLAGLVAWMVAVAPMYMRHM